VALTKTTDTILNGSGTPTTIVTANDGVNHMAAQGLLGADGAHFLPSGDSPIRPIYFRDGDRVLYAPPLTISATPDYAADDVIGTAAPYALAAVNAASGRPVFLERLVVKESGGQTPPFTILFFSATPAGGTYADNGALVWGTNDFANKCGEFAVQSGDYRVRVGKASVDWDNIGLELEVAATSLFFIPVADGAYNAGSTSALSLAMKFRQG
jgi:hypothetical protein